MHFCVKGQMSSTQHGPWKVPHEVLDGLAVPARPSELQFTNWSVWWKCPVTEPLVGVHEAGWASPPATEPQRRVTQARGHQNSGRPGNTPATLTVLNLPPSAPLPTSTVFVCKPKDPAMCLRRVFLKPPNNGKNLALDVALTHL